MATQGSIDNKNTGQSASVGNEDILYDVPLPMGDLFDDPRSGDRRRRDDPSAIPASGCRRRGERRTTVYMKSDDWWMKRNYNNGR